MSMAGTKVPANMYRASLKKGKWVVSTTTISKDDEIDMLKKNVDELAERVARLTRDCADKVREVEALRKLVRVYMDLREQGR